MRTETLTGEALQSAIPALARLRIEVFRAYPYLYDGDESYELDYLKKFAEAPGAVIVGAIDGDAIVGAATGAPLVHQHEEFIAPFREHGDNLTEIFYCGESVLRSDYRGRGLGHVFFDEREAQARRLGLTRSVFCAVIRPDDHPRRPRDYSPLDPFWKKRGYAPLPGVTTEFAWKDVGDEDETSKTMQFWGRTL